MKRKNLTSLSDFIDEKVGPKGTKIRDKYDNEFEAFKLGVLIQQARQEKGMTQEQLIAFTANPDHDRQVQVWDVINLSRNNEPLQIEGRLTEAEMIPHTARHRAGLGRLDGFNWTTPRNVSTTLRQWHSDFRLGFLPFSLVD